MLKFYYDCFNVALLFGFYGKKFCAAIKGLAREKVGDLLMV